ncbi:cyclin-like protein [Tuber indicum]|nr:cyclin-like protein [Tuber indicum]
MQARRATRQRSSSNIDNNDENRGTAGVSTRLTRAKAAALTSSDSATSLPAKTTTTGALPANRKRSALGDVSNVVKADGVDDKKAGGKKGGKPALSTKTVNGVTKQTRAKAQPIKSVAPEETKRTNSGSGVLAARKKKAATGVPGAGSAKAKEDREKEVESAKVTISSVEIEVPAKSETEVVRATKKPRVEERLAHNDLDEEDRDDPLMVSEYVNEIFEYLRGLETTTMPNPDYMANQEHLQWKMRGILVDWLIEVHTRFRLLPETLFLAVNIVDRFLSAKIVELDKLQLVGVTAMFIAAKYEEVFSPGVQYFRSVADDGFTEEEILQAERYILTTLNYNLSYPNPMNFLRRISKADQYDYETRTVAKYLLEISLLDHRFMGYAPSHVSAAAMYLSRMMLERGPWDADLVHYSDYTEEEVLPVFRLMIDYLARPVKHEAFFKKYASKKFMKASIHARQWAKRNASAHGVNIESATHDDSR